MSLGIDANAQYCSVATSNETIIPTTTSQLTTSYNSGKRAFNFVATVGCTYTFATCSQSTADTYLRLYSTGTGGTVLAFNDDGCSPQSTFSWTCTTAGTYSVLMTNYSCNNLTVATKMSYIKSCASVTPPVNDLCANATNLPCATTNLAGTTVNTVSEAAPGGYSSNYGVWYKFTGDGNSTTISSTTTFDHEMDLFSGSCGSLAAIAQIDGSTGTETYTFTSTVGVQYYIYIAHYLPGSTTTGTFAISRTCTAPCITPGTPISLLGSATSATTASISWAAGSPAGSATITYYYSVYTSTGTYVTGSSTASTSASITGLACGTSYYFTVYASTSCNSTSSLTATSSNFTSGACPPPPANDLVCNATAITCGQTLSGTTIDATNSGTGENQTCSVTQSYPGVWYVVAGNGNVMTASLCGTAWDSKISVFSGTSCASLTCVGGNDDGGPACTGTSASYSWTSVAGTNYYILVHGYSSNSAFNIALTCTAPCITPGTPISLFGSATSATTSSISWAAGSPAGSATVTYYYSVYTLGGSYVTSSSTTSTTANITGLACGTAYYFTVYANTNCNSTSSATATSVTFTTSACPNPCSTSTAMICGTTYTGTLGTVGSWSTYTSCSYSEPGEEKVYTYTPSVTDNYTFTTTSTTGDPDFFLMSTCGTTGTNIYGSCWGSGNITVNLTGGTTYYLIVDNYSSLSSADYTVSVNCLPDYRAQFISMNTGSANWCAGETRNITVNIKNTGTLPWTDGSGRDFNIGVKWNTNGTSWTDYDVRVDAQGLTPGNTATYTISLKAADFITGGAYGIDLATGPNNISFDIVSEGCFWFGSNTTNGCGVCSGNAVYVSPTQTIFPIPNVNAGSDVTMCPGSTQLNGNATISDIVSAITQTNTVSGYDDGIFFNSITTSGAPVGSVITGVSITASIGSYCPTWYEMDFNIGGTWFYSNCNGTYNYTNLNGLSANGQVISIRSWDNDSYSDYVTLSLSVTVTCSSSSTLTYLWTPSTGLSSTNISNPVATPGNTITYLLTSTANNCSAVDNVIVTVNTPMVSQTPATGDFIWNGSVSNVWETSSNWYTYSAGSYMSAGSTLPSSTTNVIIPANGNCVLAQPTAINTNSVQNVRIESNAILTMNSQGIINVKSNWLNNGTANLAGAINFNGTTNISGSGINNFDNLTVSTGSSITMASGIINIAGDWVNNGSTLFSGGLLNFNGTSFQNISGAAVPTFKNLTVSNTNGIVIDNNINVYGTLLLTNGPIDIKGSIVNLGSSGLLSGETSSKRVFSTDGGGMEPAGTGVIRATININTSNVSTGNIAGLGLDFTPSAPLGATIITRGCEQQVGTGGNSSILRYFDIQPGNKAIVPMLTINKFNYWGGTTDLELNGINETTLQMFQEVNYGGPTYWEPRTTTTSSVSDFISASTATVTNLSGIIRITLGSSNSPLPVELLNFKAECNNNESIISWQTASEENNHYFILEKSNDAINFMSYDTIEGAGNSNSILDYFYKDIKLNNKSINYYRLKQVDFNGASEYSDIVEANCMLSSEPLIVIMPNPSVEGAKIRIQGEYTNYMITDMLGRNVDCKVYDHTIVGLKAGVYIITFDNSTKIKFVVSRL
jgi:hypothetical protein